MPSCPRHERKTPVQNEKHLNLSRHELSILTSRHDLSGHEAPGNSSSYLAFKRDLFKYQHQARAILTAQWRDVSSVALTLTFRRKNKQEALMEWPDFQHDYQGYFNPHSHDGRKAIVGNMHKVFSRWAYGKAARRYGKRLGAISVWEGDHRDHAHCHMLMEIPGHWQAENQYDQRMRPFLDCHPAIGEFVLEPTRDAAGWIDYILKIKDKVDLMQAIGWDQYYKPQKVATDRKINGQCGLV